MQYRGKNAPEQWWQTKSISYRLDFISNIKRQAFIGLCAIISTNVGAADFVTSGTVTLTRVHTTQISLVSVRGVTGFQIDTPLSSRCVWLIIEAADKNTLASFLSAKAINKVLTVHYSDDVVPPWGDTASCYVTALDD